MTTADRQPAQLPVVRDAGPPGALIVNKDTLSSLYVGDDSASLLSSPPLGIEVKPGETLAVDLAAAQRWIRADTDSTRYDLLIGADLKIPGIQQTSPLLVGTYFMNPAGGSKSFQLPAWAASVALIFQNSILNGGFGATLISGSVGGLYFNGINPAISPVRFDVVPGELLTATWPGSSTSETVAVVAYPQPCGPAVPGSAETVQVTDPVPRVMHTPTRTVVNNNVTNATILPAPAAGTIWEIISITWNGAACTGASSVTVSQITGNLMAFLENYLTGQAVNGSVPLSAPYYNDNGLEGTNTGTGVTIGFCVLARSVIPATLVQP